MSSSIPSSPSSTANQANSVAPTIFPTRNVYYLRISPKIVLQLVLFLKEEHIHWFNDVYFQVS